MVLIIYYPLCVGNIASEQEGKHDITYTAGEPDGQEQEQEDKRQQR